MRLLIISHTPHYLKGNTAVGWGATILEIDHLATLFDEVTHLAPLHPGTPPKSALPYRAANLRLAFVQPAGGERLRDKLGILRRIPAWFAVIKREMRRADAVHIRCPAGISLVGLIAIRLWGKGKPTWVKYAGNWGSYPKQAWSYKLQRWYLEKNMHTGVVTINGRWPNQPAHVISFDNPSFTEDEYRQAAQIAEKKQLTLPIKLLFVGRLTKAKGVDRVLQITKQLLESNLQLQLTLVGDSQERSIFKRFVNENGMADHIHFVGWQPKMKLSDYYREAHFLIFPSISEGWPKVLSEAMAHGVVPIASAVGSIPQILAETRAGLALSATDTQSYVKAIIQYTQDADSWKQASLNGIAAGQRFTYEHYLSEVQKLFKDHLHVDLNHG